MLLLPPLLSHPEPAVGMQTNRIIGVISGCVGITPFTHAAVAEQMLEARIPQLLCSHLERGMSSGSNADQEKKLGQFALHALSLLLHPSNSTGKERAPFPLALAVVHDGGGIRRHHPEVDVPRVKASRGAMKRQW